jgi:hypothetical protein
MAPACQNSRIRLQKHGKNFLILIGLLTPSLNQCCTKNPTQFLCRETGWVRNFTEPPRPVCAERSHLFAARRTGRRLILLIF